MPNATLAVLSMNHVVSGRPVETYGFTSLMYPYALFVGTRDGETWKFDKGAVTTVPDDAPDPDGLSARQIAGIAEGCLATVTNPNQMPPAFFNTKGFFKVIEPTERSPTFELKLEPGFQAVNIMCGRNNIVPSRNDYKVAVDGRNLSISDIGEGHPQRIGVLQRIDGKFRYEIERGEPLTDDLAARVAARLEAFEKAVQPAN